MDRKVLIILLFLVLLAACTANGTDYSEKSKLVVVASVDYEDLVSGEGHENLPPLLELLDRHGADTTFFVLGATADRDPEGLVEISRRGHSIGLHTYYHNFVIFDREGAAMLGELYERDPDEIWNRSFKTEEAFYNDIKATQKAVFRAVNKTPVVFRSPSLASNWAADKRYFAVLELAGIKVDSSIKQDFENPRPFYAEGRIMEVPVVASEKRLDDLPKSLELAEKCAYYGVPLVLYIHPQNMDSERMEYLENYLNSLEDRYEVAYIKVEDVPDHFT
ncbi:polysaccharide deacetylase family protein [archaeon]|nr:polysaccharide deacetylase family protein [archaeon]